MPILPSSTLALFKSELKKLDERESSLKRELAEVASAASYLRKIVKGAEKHETEPAK
jgi:hypothetical protein